MEDALVLFALCRKGIIKGVLILVLMEDALVHPSPRGGRYSSLSVLILVLMEDALVH